MKKINILKAIVDYLWIVTIPLGSLVIIISIPSLFLEETPIDFFEFAGVSVPKNIYTEILLLIELLGVCLILYAFHLFRNTLRYFQKIKIFDVKVITTFHKIGILLIISGTASFIISVLLRIYFEGPFKILFGFNDDIVLVGLGLFFQVLSEVFKIAKAAKEENELTI